MFIGNAVIGSNVFFQNQVKGDGKKHQDSANVKKKDNGVSHLVSIAYVTAFYSSGSQTGSLKMDLGGPQTLWHLSKSRN